MDEQYLIELTKKYFDEHGWDYNPHEFKEYIGEYGYNKLVKAQFLMSKTKMTLYDMIIEKIYEDIFNYTNPSARLTRIIEKLKSNSINATVLLRKDHLLMTMYLDFYDIKTLSLYYNNLIELIFRKMNRFYNRGTGLDINGLINYATKHKVLKYFVTEVKKMISFYLYYTNTAINYTGRGITPMRLKELVVTNT